MFDFFLFSVSSTIIIPIMNVRRIIPMPTNINSGLYFISLKIFDIKTAVTKYLDISNNHLPNSFLINLLLWLLQIYLSVVYLLYIFC